MDVGDKVYVVSDSKHVGVITTIKESQAYVRWHRGYATWHELHTLRRG
jgi:hypothetical protein